MKIAFVNNQLQLGGAETVVEQLRSGIERAGHAHWLHVAHGKTFPEGVTPLYPRLLSRLSHSRFHRIVERLFPREKWTDRSFCGLAESEADLIHLHNFHGDYASIESLAHLVSRKKVVWTFHAFWGITGGCDHPKECQRYQHACGQCPQVGQWPVGAVDRTSEQLALKMKLLASAPVHVVAPSQHLAAKVRESQVGRCWHVDYIPNGVEPARFTFARKHDPQFRASLGLDPKATTILVVNRNFKDPQKGHPMVQEALAMLDGRSVQVVLAGQNSYWAAAQLPAGLPRLVAGYVTSREAMARWFEAADIFLFASPAENFPCVILEAMSAKCCVVATPTSGVVEQIEQRKTGFVAEEISGLSLGLALREAMLSPKERRICGESAREKVEREFSQELMVARHLKLYSDVISAA